MCVCVCVRVCVCVSTQTHIYTSFPGGSEGKGSAHNAGDLDSIPGLGRYPGEGKGNPLQNSCLENPWTEKPGSLQSIGLQRVGQD